MNTTTSPSLRFGARVLVDPRARTLLAGHFGVVDAVGRGMVRVVAGCHAAWVLETSVRMA